MACSRVATEFRQKGHDMFAKTNSLLVRCVRTAAPWESEGSALLAQHLELNRKPPTVAKIAKAARGKRFVGIGAGRKRFIKRGETKALVILFAYRVDFPEASRRIGHTIASKTLALLVFRNSRVSLR